MERHEAWKPSPKASTNPPNLGSFFERQSSQNNSINTYNFVQLLSSEKSVAPFACLQRTFEVAPTPNQFRTIYLFVPAGLRLRFRAVRLTPLPTRSADWIATIGRRNKLKNHIVQGIIFYSSPGDNYCLLELSMSEIPSENRIYFYYNAMLK